MVQIEGVDPDQLVNLPLEELMDLVFTGKPIVFRAGSSTVLGEFTFTTENLRVELAHIDGGGEGVLPTIGRIAQRLAVKHGVKTTEWLVYATNCARPNLKLRRVLERRGFVVKHVEGKGECYYQQTLVPSGQTDEDR